MQYQITPILSDHILGFFSSYEGLEVVHDSINIGY